jgi:hypothetical protein
MKRRPRSLSPWWHPIWPTLNSLTLEQWIEEFRLLKKLNAGIVCTLSDGKARRKPAR